MQAELTHIPVSPRTRNILLAIVAGLILLVFWKAPTLPKLLLTGMAVALVLLGVALWSSTWTLRTAPGLAVMSTMAVSAALHASVLLVPARVTRL